MKSVKLNLLIVAGLILLLSTPTQSQFVKTVGEWTEGFSVIQGFGGGIFVTGNTGSGSNALLVKFDTLSNPIWTRALSSAWWLSNQGFCLIQTSDDLGLVVTGGIVYGKYSDVLLAKFDASGNLVWNKRLGGGGYDNCGYSVIQASDWGLVVAGYAGFGAGLEDLLLAKFNSETGDTLWVRTLGRTGDMEGWSVIKASDGGLIVAGRTISFGPADYDLLLVKFNASGDPLWTRTLGGSSDDYGYSVIEASDGGLVVTGYTESFGVGGGDLLLAKFSASGDTLWTKTLGGIGRDEGRSVIEAFGGGLVVTGRTESFGDPNGGLLLAKFDSSGNYLWARVLGSGAVDHGNSVIQTANGDLVVTGRFYNQQAFGSQLVLANFDTSGYTCLGEFISPTVRTVSPVLGYLTLTVTFPSPYFADAGFTNIPLSPDITTLCVFPQAWITSISDVGNDPGRQVLVNWHRCYYDTAGAPYTITEYGIWRRTNIDKAGSLEDKMLTSDIGMFGGPRLYPPGDWEFIKTVPASGEEEYNTVCSTLGDSTQAGGMYWSVFFVSAMTADSFVYFDSEPDSGYSLDNIPPLPIEDLEVNLNSWFTLMWTAPGDYPEGDPISSYNIRYNTIPVGTDTQAWWNTSNACPGDSFFKFIVGQQDSFGVDRYHALGWCRPVVYFAIKGLDERPNASGISNTVRFLCGDCNADSVVELGDVVCLISYLYRGGPPPKPLATGDCNCMDGVELGDVVKLISYLYKGGSLPCNP